MLTDLRHRLEYGLWLVLASLVRAMPLDTATSFSAWVWRAIAPNSRRHQRALRNLALALPEKTEAEREAIARGMWDNLGRVMAETFLLDRLLEDTSRFEFEDPALIRRYRGKMGPSIFISMHMANWEIAVSLVNAFDGRAAGVYRVVENPYVDRYIHRLRSRLYPGGLLASRGDDGLSTVLRIKSYVRAGGSLVMLADHVDWRGVEVPFFGTPTWATIAPAWLARRMGARVWVGRVVRIGKQSRFKITGKELKVPRTESPEDDIKALTAAMLMEFETWIRQTPEQWMWSNKRWRDHQFKD